MSDKFVGGRSRDTATLLLAAVEDLGLDPSVVRTTSKGYYAPEEVAKKAGLDVVESENAVADEDAAPAKKTTTKKAAAKKTAAKKTGN
jgi:hypothetical protein